MIMQYWKLTTNATRRGKSSGNHDIYRDTAIKAPGLNHITKTLSINFYDIRYTQTPTQQREYLQYIDATYGTRRLQRVLAEVAAIIGANILHVATHDYEPRGASVACLISEQPVMTAAATSRRNARAEVAVGALKKSAMAHLDTSHVTAHTYPECRSGNGINTFRADLDISTCGRVSPLQALNYLIDSFDADIVILDYRVRGFTRDTAGRKYYLDHDIRSMQDFLSARISKQYRMTDMNLASENIFHTKMLLRHFNIDNYLFGNDRNALQAHQLAAIRQQLKQEMDDIFYARNGPD